MKLTPVRVCAALVVAFAGGLAPVFASPTEGEVAVVVDMTDAGRKIAPPTRTSGVLCAGRRGLPE